MCTQAAVALSVPTFCNRKNGFLWMFFSSIVIRNLKSKAQNMEVLQQFVSQVSYTAESSEEKIFNIEEQSGYNWTSRVNIFLGDFFCYMEQIIIPTSFTECCCWLVDDISVSLNNFSFVMTLKGKHCGKKPQRQQQQQIFKRCICETYEDGRNYFLFNVFQHVL